MIITGGTSGGTEDARFRRELYDVRNSPELSVAEKFDRFLELGCTYLGVENGHIKRVDLERREHYVLASAGPATDLVGVGDVHEHATTFCRRTLDLDTPLAIANSEEEGWGDDPATVRHDLQCYVGTTIMVSGETFGTLCFVSRTAHDRTFSAAERAFVELLASIIGTELAAEGYTHRLTSRDKLLSVQNRVLRHNLANDMNIITGYAEILGERLDGDNKQLVDRIHDLATDVVEMGQKARQLETVVRDETPPTVEDVVPVVQSIAEAVAEESPDATISVTAPDQCYCVASTHLQTALRELVTNAIEHGGLNPSVEVTVQTSERDRCTISVADDGPGLSLLEQKVLSGEQETQLSHGQGLGLWLVYWVVLQSGGSLNVETQAGTTVRIQLRRVQDPDSFRWARHLFLGMIALR